MTERDLLKGLRESNPSEAFQAIYRDYLEQLGELDLAERAERLGLTLAEGPPSGQGEATTAEEAGQELEIPLFGRVYRVSSRGIRPPSEERPLHAEAVLLSRYLLLAPQDPAPQRDWLGFRDFRDAAPFAGAFSVQVEGDLAGFFTGRDRDLVRPCEEVGGEDPDLGLSYTLCRQFPALPRVPVMLLFNDADEEFPAEARILFPDNAAEYLDMECLAIAGWLLKDFLRLAAGGSDASIM